MKYTVLLLLTELVPNRQSAFRATAGVEMRKPCMGQLRRGLTSGHVIQFAAALGVPSYWDGSVHAKTSFRQLRTVSNTSLYRIGT